MWVFQGVCSRSKFTFCKQNKVYDINRYAVRAALCLCVASTILCHVVPAYMKHIHCLSLFHLLDSQSFSSVKPGIQFCFQMSSRHGRVTSIPAWQMLEVAPLFLVRYCNYTDTYVFFVQDWTNLLVHVRCQMSDNDVPWPLLTMAK